MNDSSYFTCSPLHFAPAAPDAAGSADGLPDWAATPVVAAADARARMAGSARIPLCFTPRCPPLLQQTRRAKCPRHRGSGALAIGAPPGHPHSLKAPPPQVPADADGRDHEEREPCLGSGETG